MSAIPYSETYKRFCKLSEFQGRVSALKRDAEQEGFTVIAAQLGKIADDINQRACSGTPNFKRSKEVNNYSPLVSSFR